MKLNYMKEMLCSYVSTNRRIVGCKKLVGIILFTLTATLGHSQSFNPNMAAVLQDTLDYLLLINPATKGVSMGVYCPGMGLWQGVGGISHAGVPITSDMEFPLASNSKLFTATVVMMLVEDGLLHLDDSISNYLPPFANVNPNITIKQLLNHTSGVDDMYSTVAQLDSINANPGRIWNPEEVLAWIGPAISPPGVAYHYSNTNYILAGMIAESVTGYPISQLIRDSILTPLNMDSTFYAVQEPIIGTIAHPWKSGVDISATPRTSLNSAIGAAGCMYANTSEMVQWYIALMRGQVVNATTLAEMTNFLPPPANYGLGITRYTFNGAVEWGHGGIIDGGRTRTLYDTCRQVFVVGLCNANPSAIDAITVILHKVLVDYLPGCPSAMVGPTSVCEGDTAITYTIPPISNTNSYIWTLPGGVTGTSSTNSITVDVGLGATSGNIVVSGVNNYGQSAPVKLAVNINSLPPTPTVTLVGNILHSTAPVGNQWYLNGVAIPGATAQDFVVTSNGVYTVIVTLSGCSSSASSPFTTQLNVENEVVTNKLSVYPNPNDGIFKVNAPDINEGTLCIYNVLGELIYSTPNFTNQIDLTAMPGGTYYIRLVAGQQMYHHKIIVH